MLKNSFVAVAIGSLLLCAASGAVGQPSPQDSTDAAKAPKKKAVEWTNDNIASVRSPADDYAIQEQETQAHAVAAKQASADKTAADQAQTDALPPDLTPKSAAEADAMIAREKSEIASEQQYVAQTKKDLVTAPESQKARLQWRVESRGQIIERLQHNIVELEKRKAAFAKSGNETASATPSQ